MSNKYNSFTFWQPSFFLYFTIVTTITHFKTSLLTSIFKLVLFMLLIANRRGCNIFTTGPLFRIPLCFKSQGKIGPQKLIKLVPRVTLASNIIFKDPLKVKNALVDKKNKNEPKAYYTLHAYLGRWNFSQSNKLMQFNLPQAKICFKWIRIVF